jgi:hypothetical protein
LVCLFKWLAGIAYLFDAVDPPFRVQQEKVIPRSLLDIIFVQLTFQLCLSFLVQILVYVASQKPMNFLLFKSFKLFQAIKLFLGFWLRIVKICVYFEIYRKLNNIWQSLQMFQVVAVRSNLLNQLIFFFLTY